MRNRFRLARALRAARPFLSKGRIRSAPSLLLARHTRAARARPRELQRIRMDSASPCGRLFPRDAPQDLRCKVVVSFLPSAAGIAVAAAEEQE